MCAARQNLPRWVATHFPPHLTSLPLMLQFKSTISKLVLVCLPLAVSAMANTGTVCVYAQEATPTKEQAENRPENLPANINDSFLDPNMKVEDFIARFEIESREVFACREQILSAIQLKPGMSVADIGSGTGLYLRALSKSVGDEGTVFAVDISPNFVKHLRERSRTEELNNVEVVLCSDRSANLKPNSIDRAFICDVYHHFEFPQSSMESIFRAMRKGGKLILVDFDRIEGQSREWLLGHIRAPKSVFKQEVIDAGFRFEEEVEIDGFEENYLLRFVKP